MPPEEWCWSSRDPVLARTQNEQGEGDASHGHEGAIAYRASACTENCARAHETVHTRDPAVLMMEEKSSNIGKMPTARAGFE